MALADNINQAASQIAAMRDTAMYNNAWSASQAQIQRDWQEQQNAKAMAFNANEAAKNRNWQEMMSNTAHQREIKDLQAAGLNPVLSAMNGNGASVGSGATAAGVTSAGAKGDTDMSMNTALVNLLGSVYNRTTQLEAANINARTQEAIAEKQAATSQLVANIGAAASRYAADRTDLRANLNLIGDIFNKASANSNISSAVDKAKDTAKSLSNKVSDWWKSTDSYYDKYKETNGEGMSFGETTNALIGSIKKLFK